MALDDANVWRQLKNLTADELIRALGRDGWQREETRRGATLCFIKEIRVFGPPTPAGLRPEKIERRRVVIHYHPKKTWGAKFLKGLLTDIGWSDEDLRRLKLIK